MKICIVNAHWSNRGDEAALRPIINAVLYKYKDANITVAFRDRNEVQQFNYDSNRVKFFSEKFLPESEENYWDMLNGKVSMIPNMKRLVETCEEADLIIHSPGGGIISDKFWWTMQLEVLTPFIVAKKYEIPMVVASPSMGPFDNVANKNMLRKELIGYVQKCCIRESISSEYLRSIGVVDNVITTIDTAFYDDPDKTENDKIFKNDESLVNFFGNYNRVVALTLFDLKWQWFISESKDDNLIMKIEEAIYQFIEFLEEQNVGVLLVPQLFGNQNDKDYLKKFGNSRNAYILSDMYDTYMQQYVISKCFALIGMRYHSNIFAAKMGVPFVAVAYEECIFRLMRTVCTVN